MVKLLEGGLADTIYKAARFLFLDATLTRDTLTGGSPDAPWEPGGPTHTTFTCTYTCKAIEDRWGRGTYGMGLVDSTDIRVLILANSLAVEPQTGDRITIRGKTVTVVPADSKLAPIETDPARATWSLRCR